MVKTRKRPATPKINAGEMVLSAIQKLMKNTGWTARTIIKFIKTEYRILDPKISRKVSRALKRGVKLGLLQTERGRYRLKDMSLARLAQPRSAREIRMRCLPRHREQPLRVSPSASTRGSRNKRKT
ncbi:uncharacterized protein LOC142972960 [Anticarsia gemmatalis]|uniref:uncharacterized protein LOC142972960 n=1 Tax=Anticarsia gemmatalis TaxID=129554 RepID=UPI003F766D7E